jgi:peptide/nickel transport system substrate-binding protein
VVHLERRDDWQRTTLGRWGKPGPHYVAYIDPGPPDKRVITQLNHQLDIIHDTSPEGMFTLAKRSLTPSPRGGALPSGSC